jgi:hypothetical protein
LRARELAEAQGVRNIAFEQADAQVCRFPRERFDLAVSRFGTMFFADPFSLADPPVVTGILEDAGFGDVTFADVREPMYFGPDVATALDWIRGFACTREALDRLDSDAAARALGRLRVILAEHNGGRGVRFNSRAWIVTARR